MPPPPHNLQSQCPLEVLLCAVPGNAQAVFEGEEDEAESPARYRRSAGRGVGG